MHFRTMDITYTISTSKTHLVDKLQGQGFDLGEGGVYSRTDFKPYFSKVVEVFYGTGCHGN